MPRERKDDLIPDAILGVTAIGKTVLEKLGEQPTRRLQGDRVL
jgi:hypothetical protein